MTRHVASTRPRKPSHRIMRGHVYSQESRGSSALALGTSGHRYSALRSRFGRITVTGPSCQCHRSPGLRSCLGQPPHNRRSGVSVGVPSGDTYKSVKATEGGFHAGQVTNRTVSLGKLKGRLTPMEKQRGLHVVGVVTENGGGLTVSRIPSASRRSCARLQFMPDERWRN